MLGRFDGGRTCGVPSENKKAHTQKMGRRKQHCPKRAKDDDDDNEAGNNLIEGKC